MQRCQVTVHKQRYIYRFSRCEGVRSRREHRAAVARGRVKAFFSSLGHIYLILVHLLCDVLGIPDRLSWSSRNSLLFAFRVISPTCTSHVRVLLIVISSTFASFIL